MRQTALIVFALAANLNAQELTTNTDQPHIIIHNHVHTSNDMAMQGQMTSSHSSYTNSTANAVQQVISDANNKAHEYSTNVLAWITNNKKKSIFYCLLAGYGYVLYKMLRLHYSLSGSKKWAQWQRTLSLEQLLDQPQHEVATHLLTAIQRRYTTTAQLDDFIGPLVAFVHDVDKELAQLHQLVALHRWIRRLHVSFLFPQQRTLLEHAQEDIHRLTYLKNTLLNWVSEHKVHKAVS